MGGDEDDTAEEPDQTRATPDREQAVPDRARIDAAFATADVHALLCAVAHLTGNLDVLHPELAPDQAQLIVPGRGLTPDQEATARQRAADAYLAHIASAAPTHASTRDERLRSFAFIVGPDATEKWERFLTEELALEGDPRAPTWHVADLTRSPASSPSTSTSTSTSTPTSAPATPFSCAVIGAGASGLAAAHRLHQAGVAVTIFEKNDDVGGTWLENVYPGCRVDVPNQLYSFSFAQTNDWDSRFSAQPDLLAYLQRVAKDMGLRDLIRFASEVTEARFDEETATWHLSVLSTDAGLEPSSEAFDAVVCAVGQLNRPSFPDIPGRQTFAGPTFHSAAWDDTIALDDKRVAVIGSGASAAQFVPHLVDEVAHLDVFQRTPPWLLPTDNYGDPFPPEFHDLLTMLPEYGRWERLTQFWLLHEGLIGAAKVDPEWDDHTEAVSASNDAVRSMLLDMMRAKVDDDDLYEKMVPHFPPFAKRALRDDGRWANSFTRDHVELVNTPIAEITPHAVVTADGVAHPTDVLIYGTGFTASDFVAPMRVVGRHGRELNEEWGGDARAYLGITVPDFPNFFLLYGPNTNLVINGSILVMVECQVRYVVEALGRLLATGRRTMSLRRQVHDAYADEIQEGNAHMVWGVADVPSWYRNAHGRVTQNWPFDLYSYWARTLEPDLSEYDLA